ncbi:serine/threonine-protein kinase Tao-like [Dreissena polymorpha]|uniref:Uncharacterized protein n=1 Tax=Dreissena polymorpha TaxID=45954 RepID=A0A9D4MSM3_DREPO|nr:serine/threonine-protein kinase Tao-like [Dreissena polymorpha]KAH3882903.1 hypothetical protein DPMN_006849 [Dreissena polymorpha]
MATADTSSDCTEIESESCAAPQTESVEIMSSDELTSELIDVNRRMETLAFQLQYNKAEHKNVVALKDERIEKLERELEKKTMTGTEMNNDTEILTSRIYYLKKELTKLEEEKRILFTAAVHKDEEIKNLTAKVEKLHTELYVTQERFRAKTEEVQLLNQKEHRLQRQLDENNQLMAENRQFMAENTKMMKEMKDQQQRDRMSDKRDIKEMEDRLVKKIVHEIKGTSPPKAGQPVQEITLELSTDVKFPPIVSRTTPKQTKSHKY